MKIMKAAVYDRYGPPGVLRISEMPKPVPSDTEILVRIVSAAVTAGDTRIRAARFPKGFAPLARLIFGVIKPRNKILGSCFSGIVEEAGRNASAFKPGDEVCGLSGFRMRAHAEFVVVRAAGAIAQKPAGISHGDAAAILFGGTAALYFLRDRARIKRGECVAILGASGAIGAAAVQLAKNSGAAVTAVASAGHERLLLSLGADRFIDSKSGGLAECGGAYDIVLDTTGAMTIKAGKRLLAKGGRLALAAASLGQMLAFDKHVLTGTAPERAEDIAFLLSLMQQGLLRAVIDSTFPLGDIVAAHQRAEERGKSGSVIVRTSAATGTDR